MSDANVTPTPEAQAAAKAYVKRVWDGGTRAHDKLSAYSYADFLAGYAAGEQSAQVRGLLEALEFYASLKNWRTVTISSRNQRFCILTGADLEYFQEPNQDSYCGKRAREALAKFGKGG